MSIIYPDIEKLKRVLREVLSDVNRDVTPEKIGERVVQTWESPSSVSARIIYELGRYYVTRISDYTPPQTFPSTVEKPYLVDTDRYWGDDGYTIPSGYYNFLATYSRASLMYPFVGAHTKLPDLTSFPSGTEIYFCGFEHGGTTRTGIASFLLRRTDEGVKLYARYGSRFEWPFIDITDRLPADYITVSHTYYVKVNVWGAEFFIDNKLVAVALDIPEATQGVKATCPPYAICITDAPVIKRLHTLIEISFPYPIPSDIRPNPGSLTIPISPLYFRWGEGEPNPPRALRLYLEDSDTLLAGYSASGAVNSHPVPVYGRHGKTFYFMADKDGTVRIEVYTLAGNWREYDSVSYTANKLLAYIMSGDAVLARLIYEPSTTPATIKEAEAILR